MNTSEPKGKLLFLCGKMAAGKSTLARQLASREDAVLLVEDEFLERLYAGQITSLSAYVTCSSRIREALAPLIRALLAKDIAVVLDFPANTRGQRAWFRRLIDESGAGHELHFVDAPNALCLTQLRQRSEGLPADAQWTTEAEFHAVTKYFEPPAPEEGFNVVRHAKGSERTAAAGGPDAQRGGTEEEKRAKT